ncbi:MAG: rod shape-determining protein RodA [Nitrospinae bacterium CG11_big_fil_rev_8_21_14_0_20_56_8]|nr:MAG: rod shape-determining protein RodA [Nitrospinae bacterium CG11_big_fil_rev_8_21_14_0_20_56_8]
MIDRRLITNFSWWLFFITLAISILGVIFIYSANHGRPELFFRNLYIKQIYWIGYGLVVMLIAIAIDYRLLSRYAYLIYGITLLALVYVLLYGVVASGAKRWIHLGPLTVQVSELAKFSLIITLAKYFEAGKMSGQYHLKDLLIPALLTGTLGFLIAIQPDLGTAIMIFFIFLIYLTAIEMDPRTLFKLLGAGMLMAPVSWFLLKDYQKTRVLTLINPEMDPLGAGYHSIQSKIAIGSGGFWGKGLLAGTQSRLNFLPEKHTDFIFSVFAEEAGFIGVVALLTLYLIILLKGLNTTYRAADRFGLFLAFGVTGSLAFYIIFNIGMTIGIFPITGIPLPFLSYGGSSLITNYFAIGLLLNIEMRRTVH